MKGGKYEFQDLTPPSRWHEVVDNPQASLAPVTKDPEAETGPLALPLAAEASTPRPLGLRHLCGRKTALQDHGALPYSSPPPTQIPSKSTRPPFSPAPAFKLRAATQNKNC